MATAGKAPLAKKVAAKASAKNTAPAKKATPAKKAAVKKGAVKAHVSMFDMTKVISRPLK